MSYEPRNETERMVWERLDEIDRWLSRPIVDGLNAADRQDLRDERQALYRADIYQLPVPEAIRLLYVRGNGYES